METQIYDCAIIGGGPAGVTAAIYLHRANKNVVLFEKNIIGGKITNSPKVENIPGFDSISGMEYGNRLWNQLEHNNIWTVYDEVLSVEHIPSLQLYEIVLDGRMYHAKTVVVATGSTNRLLGLPNEKELIGKGISFCSVCDGAFYTNKIVGILGGGNSALQEAVELSNIANKVYIFQDLDHLTGEEKLQEYLKTKENVEILLNTKITAINGTDKLESIVINNDQIMNLDGLFIAIGLVPDTKKFTNIIPIDYRGYCENGVGVFSAGDCALATNIKQVVVAEASGAEAAARVCDYLNKF